MEIDNRIEGAIQITSAYEHAIKSVAEIGRLLRTTEAGKFMWGNDHKTAISGIKIILTKLKEDVPSYYTNKKY
jgi:hypothetical protein